MRVKGTTTRARHKKILKESSGFFGGLSRRYRIAKEAVMRSRVSRTVSRKLYKREVKQLFIKRINSFARQYGMSYSNFVFCIKKKYPDLQLGPHIIYNLIVKNADVVVNMLELNKIEENNIQNLLFTGVVKNE